MDIKQLTAAMHDFVSTQGWYEASSPKPQTLRNLAISLSLEANEVSSISNGPNRWQSSKRWLKSWPTLAIPAPDRSLAGIDLEQAILAKLDKNYHRKWDKPG